MKIIRIDSQFVGETDRTLELKEELYNHLSKPEAIDHIIDWKGHLMVYWFRIPTEGEIYLSQGFGRHSGKAKSHITL